MSCEWRHTSHDQWELTQSNPPSELPDDPIIPTSSNPDERSSSTTTRSEMSPSSQDKPVEQTADSLFSNAAQAETEPIPRDNHMPNPEDMLNPDSSRYSSLPSDIEQHITLLQTKEAEDMEPPELDPGKVFGENDVGITKSDSDDEDFEIPESDEQGSDSSYVEETPKRRGKRAVPNKKVRKAHGKPQTAAKLSANNGPTAINKPKQPVMTKGRPQKANTASKTLPKQTRPATSTADIQIGQKSAAKTPANPATTTNRASRRAQGSRKGKDTEQPDPVITDSQAPPGSQEKQATRRQLTPRLPKKSFYNELGGGPSTQFVPKANDSIKSRPDTNIERNDSRSASGRNHIPTAPPVQPDDDGDAWCPPDSPEKHEDSLMPEAQAQVTSQVSPIMLNAAVGPNSKKKRISAPVQLKSKDAKRNTTGTYGQKPTRGLGSSKYFQEPRIRATQGEKQSQSTGSKQLKDQQEYFPGRTVNPIPKETETKTHFKGDESNVFEQEYAHSGAMEEDVPEAIPSDLGFKQSINAVQTLPVQRMLSKPREINPQTVPEKQLFAATSAVDVVGGMGRPTGQTSTSHINSEKPGESSGSRSEELNIAKPSSKGTAAANRPDHYQHKTAQNISGRAEELKDLKSEKESFPGKRTHPIRPSQNIEPSQESSQQQGSTRDVPRDSGDISIQLDASPAEIIQHPKVSESGSPLVSLNMTTRNMANFGRNPSQQIQRPANREEQLKPPKKHQESINNDLPWNVQMGSEFGLHSAQRESPPPADHVHPRTHGIAKTKVLEHLENYRPISDHILQAVSSPSISTGYSTKDRRDFVPQAPKLHQRSIDFARRVTHEQKHTERSDEAGQKERSSGVNYRPAGQLSRPSYQVPANRLNESNSQLSKNNNFLSFYGTQSSKEHSDRSNPSSRSKQEAKWQGAVEAASNGVVDTVHDISMDILGHLRTREQSIFAIIYEYKRNGIKISRKLAKRQAGESLNVSTAFGQRCLELAMLYGELSKETQKSRAECSAKHRQQAYAEWQRQTMRTRAALRTAKEEC
ncbi:hypothetical protein GGS26DRAFT_586385 [Hypomontagnella submonticulosa]|nr:hypothetical protein GGS26DRAFT_586385 [Hypomontagnella submonticulosa]